MLDRDLARFTSSNSSNNSSESIESSTESASSASAACHMYIHINRERTRGIRQINSGYMVVNSQVAKQASFQQLTDAAAEVDTCL